MASNKRVKFWAAIQQVGLDLKLPNQYGRLKATFNFEGLGMSLTIYCPFFHGAHYEILQNISCESPKMLEIKMEKCNM